MRSLIVISLLLAMILSVIPLPEWLMDYRPDWVALVVLWANIHQSGKFSVGKAWLVGAFMDLINATVLGQYALAYTVTSYFAVRISIQFKLFSLIQKTLTVLLLLTIFRMLLFWIFSLSGNSIDLGLHWKPLIADVLIWPWLNATLREISLKLTKIREPD